jgi:hypothetical protein
LNVENKELLRVQTNQNKKTWNVYRNLLYATTNPLVQPQNMHN